MSRGGNNTRINHVPCAFFILEQGHPFNMTTSMSALSPMEASSLMTQVVNNMMTSIENSPDFDELKYPDYMGKEEFKMFLMLAAQRGNQWPISQQTLLTLDALRTNKASANMEMMKRDGMSAAIQYLFSLGREESTEEIEPKETKHGD